MYGAFVLLEKPGAIETGERIYVGDQKGRDEAWLRDTLFDHPEIIPLEEIDPAFGSLVPLCKELRTDAGPIDAVFIDERGRLTIVECKLWKNPQARREVVAQALDYVSALADWSYADLRRQVTAALGKRRNTPYEIVQALGGSRLREREFVDFVSRSLREGRILVLIAGDGVREGVQAIAELVDRRATKGFSFGLVEVALYQFGKGRLAIQPRVLAKTEIIRRHVTIVNARDGMKSHVVEDTEDEEPQVNPRGSKAHLRNWWQKILEMKFDDPEQDSPFWVATNNVVLSTPFPGVRIKALATVDGKQTGVFVSGRRIAEIQSFLRRERASLLKELPDGTEIKLGDDWPIVKVISKVSSDDERRASIMKTMNEFVNVLRPRLRKWYAEAETKTETV